MAVMRMMSEASLEAGTIEVDRGPAGSVEITDIWDGEVSMDSQEARTVAMFILATHPDRDPFTCTLCGEPKDPRTVPPLGDR